MSYTTVKHQCNDVVQRLGVTDIVYLWTIVSVSYTTVKRQCNDVVQRLGVRDMFICGPLFW